MRMGLWKSFPELRDVRLGEGVRANRQPLDMPDTAAMGLYLQADKAAVSGAARLRLQIGLRGAERKGVRPTMNVSVVVDLSSTAQQPNVQQVRAIVTALASAHQPGDRFSLSVAGKDGGLLVESGNFRHGPLQVALARMYGDEAPADAQPANLADAIQIAANAARGGDDPGAVFGSSLVLLVTHGVTEAQLPALQDIAHRNVVGGIALSAIDTRNSGVLGADGSLLERLVAAGQGQRRSMAGADDAARVIDAELHAASRAVARAARLRIRLAPGVQLLDVLGSQRLEEPQAERVREAEQSIDQRLSRNLGIRADRGEDEDGIQIVIPNFHAGDSHVILLDVLVDGPGPVADVTLRYKDLVHLKNGVARAELRLPAGDRSPGPLQRNVLKNRVAFELAQAARIASRYLEQKDMPRAIGTLQSMHDLLVGLRETVGGWSSDRELLADAGAVAGYVAYLQNHAPTHPFIHRYAVESLRYMALRKLTAADEEPQR
ncbi:MAG: kinetochore protein SPC24, partial [Gammaproteobacteria bacterium]|nr:kinetochore protein SPC24 [Gammaproteobacteria bacterium]